ncbi:hypothetical protein DL98DRAFT_461433 [Cadophora sp. DSE1049]|nr:hypothetical protein DL98DRAFT_461433 [Cadophora sp. DSE1049]
MATKPVVLILGAGPRSNRRVPSNPLLHRSYSVALASRRGTNTLLPSGHLSLTADFSTPSSIPSLFAAVQKQFSSPPSVVIYNAGAFTPPPSNTNVLSIPAEGLVGDMNVNTVSAYVAAQEAVKAWEETGKGKGVFIYTGNICNVDIVPWPMMLTGGAGKAATAYWIGLVDGLMKEKGYRFFYADERFPDGKLKGAAVDGDAHGEFYVQSAKQGGGGVEGNERIPWHATFVKGKGYVYFKKDVEEAA